MPTFEDAIQRGAKRLNIPAELLVDTMRQAAMTADVWVHVTLDDFVRELDGRLKGKGQPVSTYLLRAAHADMNQLLQGTTVGLPPGITPTTATVEQLVEVVDLRDPDSPAMQALLDREVAGTKLRDVAFFVLRGETTEETELDRQATRTVLDLLRRGLPAAADELVDPSGTVYVVYRFDELPSTQHLIDPMFPHLELKLGISTPFQVVVGSRLSKEQHQLLLFMRSKGKVPEPKSKPACEDLLAEFRTRPLKELLDRYGARGVYEKAARLPEGAPAGLPTVVRTAKPAHGTREAASSSDSFRAARVSAMGRVFASYAFGVNVPELRGVLGAMGASQAGTKEDLVNRLMDELVQELEAPNEGGEAQRLPRLRSFLGACPARVLDDWAEEWSLAATTKADRVEEIVGMATRLV